MLGCFSRIWLFATPWTVACQAPIHGILQARILEWVVISFSRGSSQPRDGTRVSCTSGRIFTTEPPGKPLNSKWSNSNSRRKTVSFFNKYYIELGIVPLEIKDRHDPKCTAYIIKDDLSVSFEVTIPLINLKRERYRVTYFTGRVFPPCEQEEQHMNTLYGRSALSGRPRFAQKSRIVKNKWARRS